MDLTPAPRDLAVDDLVTTDDLRRLGHDPFAIRQRCRAGELRRLVRGWYAVCDPAAARPPWEVDGPRWESAQAEHLLRVRALVRSFAGRAAASHQSAALLHGGRLWRADLELVHLERTGDDHSRHRRGGVLHPRSATRSVSVTAGYDHPGGYLAVPPADAAVQVGLLSARPGQPAFPLASLVAAEGFLHSGAITRAELDEAVAAREGTRGITAVRQVLAGAAPGSESVGETRVFFTMTALGYEYDRQVQIDDGDVTWRTDAMLRGEPVCVEFDGHSKYLLGVVDPSEADIRRALALEKRRQDRISALGYGFARITWDLLDNPRLVKARIEEARRLARRRSA